MAPRAIHEQPQHQLLRLAFEAREEGLDFDAFWTRAVREARSLVMTNHASPPEGAVRWPTDRSDRKSWQHAIHGSKEGWRRAYEGTPAPMCEQALAMLSEAFSLLDDAAATLAAREETAAEQERSRALPARDGLASAA